MRRAERGLGDLRISESKDLNLSAPSHDHTPIGMRLAAVNGAT